MIITNPANIFYLTGFTGSFGILIFGPKDKKIITDPRYDIQAHKEIKDDIKIHISSQPYNMLFSLLKKKKTIGIEDAHMNVGLFNLIKKNVPGIKLKPVQNYVEKMRIKKTAKEISVIRKSVKITEQALKKVVLTLHAEKRECDVAARIEYEMKLLGAQKQAFDIIVASGVRSAMPHAIASTNRITKGKPIVIDCGCIYKGYNSDLTRTYFLDKITPRFNICYERLLEAQRRAIELVKPGICAKDLEFAVRKILKDSGLDKKFIHSLGHGVGVNVHELPHISSKSNFILEEGMVFTIEPGVYLPGQGGIRIEDMVVVTDKGCKVLTSAPKELETMIL